MLLVFKAVGESANACFTASIDALPLETNKTLWRKGMSTAMEDTLKKQKETVASSAAPEDAVALEEKKKMKWLFQTRTKKSRKPTSQIKLTYYTLFWVFFIGCIMGVLLETVWCLLTSHRLENRVGLVYGPFNPVYGFGAVLMTVALKWLSEKRDLWIFLGSMVIGGGFEYLCSLVMELSFGTVSWEYSGTPLNLDGRTNIMYSFYWGLLGLIWVKELFPRLNALIEKIPKKLGVILTVVLTAFMVFDMLISAMALERQSQRRAGIPASNAVSQFLDEHYPDEFLKKIYPNMLVVDELPE